MEKTNRELTLASELYTLRINARNNLAAAVQHNQSILNERNKLAQSAHGDKAYYADLIQSLETELATRARESQGFLVTMKQNFDEKVKFTLSSETTLLRLKQCKQANLQMQVGEKRIGIAPTTSMTPLLMAIDSGSAVIESLGRADDIVSFVSAELIARADATRDQIEVRSNLINSATQYNSKLAGMIGEIKQLL
tara:strand:- start:81 stop:665 length:585 start_codon:yes stop_codon:yes gene_type:complete